MPSRSMLGAPWFVPASIAGERADKRSEIKLLPVADPFRFRSPNDDQESGSDTARPREDTVGSIIHDQAAGSEKYTDESEEPEEHDTDSLSHSAVSELSLIESDSREDDDALWVTIDFPAELMRYIVPKGYITLDGTSLTVVDVYEASFTVQLVAFTQTEIILPMKKVGDKVNVEVDVLGKYVEKMLGYYQPDSKKEEKSSGITADFLAQHGYG